VADGADSKQSQLPCSGRPTRGYRRALRMLLVASTLLAFGLRFAALGFGRGTLTARADEELLRSGVLISLTGDLNPHYAVWGHLFHYLCTASMAALLAIRVLLGQVPGWTEAVAELHCEPWTFIWVGRAISAAAGVLTLVATHRLARRATGSRLVAAASCLVLSVLFLHVRDSHFATCDVLLGLLSTAALAEMAGRGGIQPLRAGIWTGLALAAKLLAATVVLTFLTILLFRRESRPSGGRWSGILKDAARFLFAAAAVALLVQPFLILDPMETCYGLFGDLFNPERRPFEHGFSLTNASIVLRYYVPQAMGWILGGSALVGAMSMLRRPRWLNEGVVLMYVIWSAIAILSVQRIFLRYLVPLLPVLCVLMAAGIAQIVRWATRGWGGRVRLAGVVGCTVLAAAPNLARDVALDYRLSQVDTRALAGQWITEHVPQGSRILWSGYGSINGHITMPWLLTDTEHDREHAAIRQARGLATNVDDAIIEFKRVHGVPRYRITRLSFDTVPRWESGFDAYPMLDNEYDVTWLKWLDERMRRAGIVTRESPRWDLMRRHVTDAIVANPEHPWPDPEAPELREWLNAEFVVLTGMPVSEDLITLLEQSYDEVQQFDPGVPWGEYLKGVMYDAGDAWYVPNIGISRVDRPGPQIRIFRRR
jgi:hypothetical protein